MSRCERDSERHIQPLQWVLLASLQCNCEGDSERYVCSINDGHTAAAALARLPRDGERERERETYTYIGICLYNYMIWEIARDLCHRCPGASPPRGWTASPGWRWRLIGWPGSYFSVDINIHSGWVQDNMLQAVCYSNVEQETHNVLQALLVFIGLLFQRWTNNLR